MHWNTWLCEPERFNTISTGCQILIGDGLRGTDEIEVPVVNGEYCKTAKIGRAIMDAISSSV